MTTAIISGGELTGSYSQIKVGRDETRGFPSCRRAAFGICLLCAATIVCTIARAEPVAGRPMLADTIAAPFATFVAEASRRFGIPAEWIRAVMCVESFGEPHAVSPKGAMGLMQVMPETWAGQRARYGLGTDPYDAHDNIMAGVAYLRELYDRYGTIGFLAAYNAGPARWEDYLTTGRAIPAETRDYLIRLITILDNSTGQRATVAASIMRHPTQASPPLMRPANQSTDNPSSSAQQSPFSPSDRPVGDRPIPAPKTEDMFFLGLRRAW
ncbi:MAG: putative soluble lytic murein transglycosylase precursor [Rhodospirillales bacterium]|nr:putative soluble lytic murein transglycosylase precursor [Rhodospirillales bacterium]